MTLSDAEKRVAAFTDDIINLDDFGVGVYFSLGRDDGFTIIVNDWTGRETSQDVHQNMVASDHHLRWIIHDLIENLNVRAS